MSNALLTELWKERSKRNKKKKKNLQINQMFQNQLLNLY